MFKENIKLKNLVNPVKFFLSQSLFIIVFLSASVSLWLILFFQPF